MVDTHAHLQFNTFDGKVKEVLNAAQKAGVDTHIIPSTDIDTSKKAIELSSQFENVYAAVGIHPHHLFQMIKKEEDDVSSQLKEIETLLSAPKVVAVGEVGMDRHYYKKTKYETYHIVDEFIDLQKKALTAQMQFAIKHKKSLILHNREAIDNFLEVVDQNWDESLAYRTVFHCCEPHDQLLEFAITHTIFIGVDGDVTYSQEKQEFVKKVPLELLVLETDSPFLIPEPLRSQKVFPNTPANLTIILKFLSNLLKVDVKELDKITTENSKKLFSVYKVGP